MIAHVNGKLIHKTTESVVIDVSGVGYEVIIPLSTYYLLPELNEPLALKVHTNVREDAIQLFGFLTNEEKEAFQLLISVSGVGPKLARNILSGITVDELVSAISASDKVRLSAIPGIGAKSAERLILELKDKVRKIAKAEKAPKEEDVDSLSGDVISALDNLGYKTQQSTEAVKKAKTHLHGKSSGFEDLFKEALKILSKK